MTERMIAEIDSHHFLWWEEGGPIWSNPLENWGRCEIRGNLYPDLQVRVLKDVDDGLFYVVDETPWDGFRETVPQVIGNGFLTVEEAIKRANEMLAQYSEDYPGGCSYIRLP